ncbi:FAD-dependent oxidoreductase, partial [Mesorhizobium japonicum]|uniref:FAD-dependent oxidoreductase n=1 Tax=Mesorhizobium japonicum TaxID=2066070 RepID=UPI003B5C0C7F
MQTLNTTLLIIGGGPGGYVTAIRAGQLGISTILVEGQSLGGTCLNIGCIPSKALIHEAEQFHQTQHHSQHSALGISVSAPTLDISKSVEWKDGIVRKLNAGVAALLKKAKGKVITGWANFEDAKTCVVTTDDGEVKITAEHVILATGSGNRLAEAITGDASRLD